MTIVERSAAGWQSREAGAGEHLRLTEPSLELEVDALCGSVVLEP